MTVTKLQEASLVDLWKTKCDSLRAFEPSTFYKDILMSKPIEKYYYRGIKESDFVLSLLEDTDEAEITLGLVSTTYSKDMFNEFLCPRVREHFGKFAAIIVFDKGTKAYILPPSEKETVYDYEKEALTFGKFLIKRTGVTHKIPSPEEEKGYYLVEVLLAKPIEQSMDLAQEVQSDESNRIIHKYSNENILQMYQNYMIAKNNELDAKYIAVPDSVSNILIIDDKPENSWCCIAYSWTFNEDYFNKLSEYFDVDKFLSDIKNEHKKCPKKIIFKDRYFQKISILNMLPDAIEIIFKNCEIGILEVCKEAEYNIKTKESTIFEKRVL